MRITILSRDIDDRNSYNDSLFHIGNPTSGGAEVRDSEINQAAQAAMDFMRSSGIPLTPNNYEIGFAFAAGEPSALTERLDSALKGGTPITPAMLDGLHHEFFQRHLDISTIQEGSRDLAQIAADLAGHISSDRIVVRSLGDALSHWADDVKALPMDGELLRATHTLSSATAVTGDRMRVMEQLLAASLERISELDQKLAKAEREATRDALTGLLNRRAFDANIRRLAERPDLHEAGLVLLMLDIDHFKRVNDTYGHPVGDLVLRLVARVLENHIKGRDIAARYGGEEFAVILPNTSLTAGATVAEQLRSLLERHPIVNRATGQRIGIVTCSIGVAAFRPGEAVIDLISRADRALYSAKGAGRNRIMTELDLDRPAA